MATAALPRDPLDAMLDDVPDAAPAPTARSASRDPLDAMLDDVPDGPHVPPTAPIPARWLDPNAPAQQQVRVTPSLAPVPVPGKLAGPPEPPPAPGYMGIPATKPVTYDFGKAYKATKENWKQIASGVGGIVKHNPDYGGTGDLPTHEEIQAAEKAQKTPALPVSAGLKPGTLEHGVLTAAESLTTPENAAILAATQGLGIVGGTTSVLGRASNAGLSAYFTYGMGKGATEEMKKAKQAFDAGDTDQAVDLLGAGATSAILAGLGLIHAGRSAKGAYDVFNHKVDAHNAHADSLLRQEQEEGKREASAADLAVRLFDENTPVDVQGRRAEIRLVDLGKNGRNAGRPYFHVVDPETGQILHEGFGSDVQGWLRQMGATSPNAPEGAPLSTPFDPFAGMAEEVRTSPTRGAEPGGIPPTYSLVPTGKTQRHVPYTGGYDVKDFRTGKTLFRGAVEDALRFMQEQQTAWKASQAEAATVKPSEPAKPTPVERPSPATPIRPTASEPTTPESNDTILLQLEQLQQGLRRVVMIPKGTPGPGVDQYPSDVVASDDYRNVYVFRPDLVKRSEIKSAAQNNKLNEILGHAEHGLGAPDKSALQGPPILVVARTPEGTEIQSTVTDEPNLQRTLQVTQMLAGPNGTVSIEQPGQVLADRQGQAQPQPPSSAPAAPAEPAPSPEEAASIPTAETPEELPSPEPIEQTKPSPHDELLRTGVDILRDRLDDLEPWLKQETNAANREHIQGRIQAALKPAQEFFDKFTDASDDLKEEMRAEIARGERLLEPQGKRPSPPEGFSGVPGTPEGGTGTTTPIQGGLPSSVPDEQLEAPESLERPIGQHGPIFHEYAGKPQEAIAKLQREQTGEIPRVWFHPDKRIGWIDLIWGRAGNPKKNFDGGYGLAHIIAKHVKAQKDLDLQDLAKMIPGMVVDEAQNDGRTLQLRSDTHNAAIRLDWDAKEKHWLLTAFEKRPPTEGSPFVPGAPLPQGAGHPPAGGHETSVPEEQLVAPEPIENRVGPHGPIFSEFSGKPEEAVQKLLQERTGEVPEALPHPDLDVAPDLIWGEEGKTRTKGYGLAKIERWHPEVLDRLGEIFASLPIVSENENTIQFDDGKYRAVVRKNWLGHPKSWLLTEFEKRPSAERTMDVLGTHATERQTPPSGGPAPSVTKDLAEPEPIEKPPATKPTGKLGLHLIQSENGRWSFVGNVPAPLALVREDGTPATSEDIEKAKIAGPAFAGLKPRTWSSEEEARAALHAPHERPAPAISGGVRKALAGPGPTPPETGAPTSIKDLAEPEAIERPEKIEPEGPNGEVQIPSGAEDRGALGGELSERGKGAQGGRTAGQRRRPGRGAISEGAERRPSERTGVQPSRRVGESGVGDPANDERNFPNFPPRSGQVAATRLERDYRIPDGRLVSGSPETRAKNNIAAIELLRELERGNRPATVDEQAILAGYVGWGAVPQIFAAPTAEWKALQDRLRHLISEEEFENARRSTTNAHYTSDAVVDAMWAAMQHLGAQAGMSWLEPAVGVGNFFGRQPEDLLEGARRVGVEKDALTASIAKFLYPESGIDHMPFEEAELPDNYFDSAISNVPFGDFGVHDPAWRNKSFLTKPIHNYFFAKSLEYVRPGGVVAFVTSRYTMDGYDKPHQMFRDHIANQADFLGAVRLPTNAFQQSSGTHVITDIIFLRKRLPGAEPAGEKWSGVETRRLPSEYGYSVSIPTNEYYHAHPENVLGQEKVQRGQFTATDYAIDGSVTKESLEAALKKALPADSFQAYKPQRKSTKVAMREISVAEEAKKIGGLFFDEKGNLFRKTSKGAAEPIDVPAATKERIRGQLAIRNILTTLIADEQEDKPESVLNQQRRALNTAYDQFVKKHGPLSSRTNVAAMDGDPDAPLLTALERKYDEKTKTAQKSAIFEKRIFLPVRRVESAGDPKEALSVTLNETGRIDWGRMQELTGQSPQQLQAELKGIVFQDPKTREWQTGEEYLSGAVRSKLKDAKKLAKVEPQFEENVKALEQVIPEDIPPSQISALPGVTWVPTNIYGQFIQDVLNSDEVPTVHYFNGEWHFHRPYTRQASKWATADVDAYTILKDTMNLRRTKVYDDDGRVDKKATLAAREKQKQLADYFEKWIFSDEKRTDELTRLYNDLVNDLRLRTYDGSHLTLPEIARAVLRSGDLEPYQKAAVWRQICQRNVLLAHTVGSGKTFEMITGAMELKRLGLIKRPMFVVPNSTLTGWQQQFAMLYPQKRVLVFSEKDLERKNRRKVFAQIATGDWDAVVVPHSSFQFIPVGDEIFQEHYKRKAEELEISIKDASEAGADTRLIKRMEKAKEKLLTAMLQRRNESKQDKTVTWEQMGIDQLYVDEAHEYKKLGFSTKQQNVAGIDPNGNQKTFDLKMKVDWTQKHGRGVTFASGTPVTNTMGELFNVMQYLIQPDLDARGLGRFDEWSASFGRAKDVFEPKPEGGGYQVKSRYAEFVNVAELSQLFRSFADVLTSDMLDIPRPKIAGGERRAIVNELSKAQREVMSGLQERAAAIRANPRDALPDNMAALYTDAQKMALDPRMLNPSAEDHPDSRLNQAADEIYRLWQESKDTKGTQLVFADFGKPKEAGGAMAFSAYDDLIQKLKQRGIPADEIAHIYSAKTKTQRTKLFQKVNDGEIRVLIGSTGKMGVGVNVQERIYAMHHLTLPHRPSDLEQREGRGIRQGNIHPEVHIIYYITKGSLDELKFANVSRKAKAFAQFMQGKSTLRKMEDVDDMAPSLDQFQAEASGDPRVKRKLEVDNELMRLSALNSAWRDERWKNRQELNSIPGRISRAERGISDLKRDIAAREKAGRVWQIGKKRLEGEGLQKSAAAALEKRLEEIGNKDPMPIGSAHGLELTGNARTIRVGEFDYPVPVSYQEAEKGQKPVISGVGTFTRIENYIKNLQGHVLQQEDTIRAAQKDQAQLEEAVEAPWPNQEEFEKLQKEQAELFRALGGNKGDSAAMASDEDIDDTSVEASEAQAEEEEEGEESEAKQPSFRPWFEPLRPDSANKVDLARQTQVRIGKDEDGEEHVYVNTPGMFILRDVLRALAPSYEVPYFDGLTITTNAAEAFIRHLIRSTHQGDSEFWPAYRLLESQLRKALETQTHAVTIVHADPGISQERIRKAEIEEAFHRMIAQISGNRVLPKQIAEAFLNAIPSQAAERTSTLRPYLQTKQEILEELLTYLAHGESDKLELTVPETADVWQRFRNLLSTQYGEQARELFDEFARARNYPHYPDSSGSANKARPPTGALGEGQAGRADEKEGPIRYRPAEERLERTGSAREALVWLKKGARFTAEAADEVRQYFAPQTRGALAKVAEGRYRNMLGSLALQQAQTHAALEGFRRELYKLPIEHGIHGLDIIDAIEGGRLDDIPEGPMRRFAETARELLDDRKELLEKLGILNTFIENYFPHLYKKPEQAESWTANWMSRRPLAGREEFRKRRTYPTMREALEDPDFDMQPRFDNPVDFLYAALSQMDKSIYAHELFEELKEDGYLVFSPNRPTPQHAEISDKLFTVYGPRHGAVKLPENAVTLPDERPVTPEEVRVYGRRTMGKYWAPEQMAQVINNDLNPGIRDKAAFQAWMRLKGVWNAANLGFSAFHATTTGMNSIYSDLALGAKDLLEGKPLRGLRTLGTAPAAPVADFLKGTYLEKVYKGQVKNPTAMDLAVVEALKRAGYATPQHGIDFVGKLKKAMSEGRNADTLGHALNPLLYSQLITDLIMKKLVPRIKLAAFANAAERAIREHSDMTPDEANKVFGEILNSIDNRIGLLSQRNMFMNPVVRDVVNVVAGRPGWTIGTIRELFGGAMDAGMNFFDLARGRKPKVSHRTAYLLALLVGGALIHGIVNWLLTGTLPKGADYIAPRDGGVTEDGHPSRIIMPDYLSKDVYSWATRPVMTLKAKLAQPLMVAGDLAANRDFQDRKIYGRGGIGLMHYLAELGLPYAATGLLKDLERAEPGIRPVLPFVGVLPASRRVGLSKAEQIITGYQDEQRAKVRPAPTAHTRARNEVYQAAKHDQVAARRIGAEQIRAGNMSAADVKNSIQRAKETPLVNDIKRINDIGVVLEVYDAATPQERKQIQSVVRKKVANARSQAWKWDPKSRKMAAKYFGIHPYLPQAAEPSDLAAPAMLQ